MTDKLTEICQTRRQTLCEEMAKTPLVALESLAKAAPPPRGFAAALRSRAAQTGGPAFIAEIKKASPSAGLIRPDFDVMALARAYEAGGAACLSVLTEKNYFQGDDGHIALAHAACALPVLRKDFMIDPWQIAQSRALGADCVLLILAVLDDELAGEMAAATLSMGMDVLLEVHDAAEMERALRLPQECLIGINNRNLKTLEIDLATTEMLASVVFSGRLIVSESGIRSRADVLRLTRAGASAFLVGESLMRQENVTTALRSLCEG